MKNEKVSKFDPFELNFDDVNFTTNKNINNRNLFNGQLNIGDIVTLKGTDYNVIIKQVNFNVPGLGQVDYAGTKVSEKESEDLVLFNLKDIESKVINNFEQSEVNILRK